MLLSQVAVEDETVPMHETDGSLPRRLKNKPDGHVTLDRSAFIGRVDLAQFNFEQSTHIPLLCSPRPLYTTE